MTEMAIGADSDIAIIGMAGRFPGADGLESFWENLSEGVVSISFFSDEELTGAGVDASTLADPSYVKVAPILHDIDKFDAALFGYVPREAMVIDPQQRVLLECAWEAMEDAGYSADAQPCPVGVFAGTSLNTYFLATGLMHRLERDFVLTLSSSDKDFAATRIAYKLNLEGPAVTVQSACSTSLVAVHMACQALLGGECDMALAGGVCVKVPQQAGYFWQEGGIVSHDGHVRPFDAAATGTVFGSGAGLVVMRPLSDALAAGDPVRAVIKGSAMNNDGSVKASFTAPSVGKQAEVVVEALARAGLTPDAVSYVEAHGTGTALGDPIELAALTKAWRTSTSEVGRCAIGSVKANIGHAEAASGVIGLIKTVLALEHEAIPPLAEWTEPNPACEFTASPFFVNTELMPWPRQKTPRRAGISSLGVGGTNAHVVVEEAPLPDAPAPSRPFQILPVSAQTGAALAEVRRRTAAALDGATEFPLADIAFTLQTGRRKLNHRGYVVVDGREDAIRRLSAPVHQDDCRPGRRRRDVVFVFPSDVEASEPQVAELRDEAVFRAQFARCYRGVVGSGNRATVKLTTFAVEYALAHLWLRWGLRPKKLIGEGVGYAVAECVGGSLSLEDALLQVSNGILTPSFEPLSETVGDLAASEGCAFLVLGGDDELARVLEQRGGGSTTPCVASLAATSATGAQTRQLLSALGALWTAGVEVDWSSLHTGDRRRRVRLPTYPFQRERHWWESTAR